MTPDIKQKTIGALIDELITADIKCFLAQDLIGSNDDAVSIKAARDAQAHNARRSKLIRAIDDVMGFQDTTQSAKTYGN